jgi:hypothetical protein
MVGLDQEQPITSSATGYSDAVTGVTDSYLLVHKI